MIIFPFFAANTKYSATRKMREKQIINEVKDAGTTRGIHGVIKWHSTNDTGNMEAKVLRNRYGYSTR